MPFGEYKDFAQCIAKNSDKDSPEGYCAAIHKKIKGKWPSEKNSIAILHEKCTLKETNKLSEKFLETITIINNLWERYGCNVKFTHKERMNEIPQEQPKSVLSGLHEKYCSESINSKEIEEAFGAMSEIAKMHSKLVEGKVYVKSAGDAPKGASLKKGAKGGLYYDDTGTKEEPAKKDKEPETKKIDNIDEANESLMNDITDGYGIEISTDRLDPDNTGLDESQIIEAANKINDFVRNQLPDIKKKFGFDAVSQFIEDQHDIWNDYDIIDFPDTKEEFEKKMADADIKPLKVEEPADKDSEPEDDKTKSVSGQEEFESALKQLKNERGELVKHSMPVDDLVPTAHQDLDDLDDSKVDAIKKIMKEEPNSLNPIIVRKRTDTGEFRVMDGNHRLRAAKELGITPIKVIIAKRDLKKKMKRGV